jgi:hypothetical protein
VTETALTRTACTAPELNAPTLDQRRALAAIGQFLKTRCGVFVIHGLKGTGKTSLLRCVACHCPDAVLELRPKSTAHLRDQFRVPARDKALLLLDEAAFVSEQLRDQMLASGVRQIIACVDPSQLPLVRAPGFAVPNFELHEVHRAAWADPVTRQGHAVLSGLGYAPDGDAFQVASRGTHEQLRTADVVLCWHDQSRRVLNQLCRHARGVVPGPARRDGAFDPRTNFPTQGDLVVVRGNGPRNGLWPGAVGWLDDDLRAGDTEVTLFQMSESWGSCGGYCFPLLSFEGMAGAGGTPDGLMLDFRYSLTVPDAMGGKWRNVLLLDEYPLNDPQRSAWLYSAISRATERVVVVNSRCK